jgi:hypothetical protein
MLCSLLYTRILPFEGRKLNFLKAETEQFLSGFPAQKVDIGFKNMENWIFELRNLKKYLKK